MSKGRLLEPAEDTNYEAQNIYSAKKTGADLRGPATMQGSGLSNYENEKQGKKMGARKGSTGFNEDTTLNRVLSQHFV